MAPLVVMAEDVRAVGASHVATPAVVNCAAAYALDAVEQLVLTLQS